MIRIAIVAAGNDWESGALAEIERANGLEVVRRCVDIADLLALAGTGKASAAIVDLRAAGLDLDVVRRLDEGKIRVFGWQGSDAARGITQWVESGQIRERLTAELAVEQQRPHREPLSRSELIGVWGPGGAPGRTTIAVAVASLFAQWGIKTILVDADMYGGTVAQHLAVLDEVSGVMAACRSVNAGKPEQVFDQVLALSPTLDLMTGIPRPDMWRHIKPQALDIVLEQLRTRYEAVIIDIGFGVEPAVATGPARDQVALRLLDQADQTAVVGAADPIGLTRLIRALDENLVPAQTTTIVINRLRSSLQWGEREISELLQRVVSRTPDHFVEFDQAQCDQAVLNGISVDKVDPRSKIASSIEGLARDLAHRTTGSKPPQRTTGGRFSFIVNGR